MLLDIRTAAIQVQTAITECLELAYGWRRVTAPTVAALAVADVGSIPDRSLGFVEAEGTVYRLLKASTLAVNHPYVVETGNNTGRWIQQFTTMTLGPNFQRPLHRIRDGYARKVEEWAGQDDEALERIFAQTPAFTVELIEDSLASEAYRHGGVYRVKWKFVIHCWARNLRHGRDALLGSDQAEDSGVEPERGAWRMVGDVRYLLAGTDLGIGPQIMRCSVDGSGRVPESDLAQRKFRAEVDIEVLGSVHRMDEDLLQPQISVERYDVGHPVGQTFDPRNFVANGLKIVDSESSLVASPVPGAAVIEGGLVSVVPATWSFAPNAWTYRDLTPDGEFHYSATAPNADPPAQYPGSLRVGLSVTDASGIVSDQFLCSYRLTTKEVTGDPFEVTP